MASAFPYQDAMSEGTGLSRGPRPHKQELVIQELPSFVRAPLSWGDKDVIGPPWWKTFVHNRWGKDRRRISHSASSPGSHAALSLLEPYVLENITSRIRYNSQPLAFRLFFQLYIIVFQKLRQKELYGTTRLPKFPASLSFISNTLPLNRLCTNSQSACLNRLSVHRMEATRWLGTAFAVRSQLGLRLRDCY